MLVVVWRTGCSTCRLSMPFFDRIAAAYPEARIVALSQDDPGTTVSYAQENALRLPIDVDEGLRVARLFDVRTVPTYWLVDAEGDVLESGEGWDTAKVESIGARIAKLTNAHPTPIVRPEDGVPAFKPGTRAIQRSRQGGVEQTNITKTAGAAMGGKRFTMTDQDGGAFDPDGPFHFASSRSALR